MQLIVYGLRLILLALAFGLFVGCSSDAEPVDDSAVKVTGDAAHVVVRVIDLDGHKLAVAVGWNKCAMVELNPYFLEGATPPETRVFIGPPMGSLEIDEHGNVIGDPDNWPSDVPVPTYVPLQREHGGECEADPEA